MTTFHMRDEACKLWLRESRRTCVVADWAAAFVAAVLLIGAIYVAL